MSTDYFTRAEFRTFANDTAVVPKYSDAAIDRAQAEVIERIEEWSQSAWPNVAADWRGSITTGTAALTLTSGVFAAGDVGKTVRIAGAGAAGADLVTTILTFTDATHVVLANNAGTTVVGALTFKDGDGTAARPRSAVETFDGGRDSLVLSHTPLLEVDSLVIRSVTVDPLSYAVYDDDGIIGFDTALQSGRRMAVVTFDFGHTSTPFSVKRPAMQATKSLLDSAEGRTRIPPNTKRYVTETAEFELSTDDADSLVFSWDKSASDALKSFWGSPVVAGAV